MVQFASQKRRRLRDLHFVSKGRSLVVHDTHIEGAPDLIVEIVSPDSVSRDWQRKYIEYEKAGVKESWVIDPRVQRMEAYSNRGKRFAQIPEKDSKIISTLLPKFYLRPEWVWRQPLPPTREALRELGIK
jgi:Uma2 family endonuclease